MSRRRIKPNEVEQARRFLEPPREQEQEQEHRDEDRREAEREREGEDQ